jgi:CHAD domain-containing protein
MKPQLAIVDGSDAVGSDAVGSDAVVDKPANDAGPEPGAQPAEIPVEAVADASPERPSGPKPHDLGPDPGRILASDGLALAGRKAMWTHVGRLLKHEAAMRDPGQADELRRYRVATRRLRAALRLFGPAFRPGDVEPVNDGLSDLADAVGLVRDLDVRKTALQEWAAARLPESGTLVRPLLDAWQAERDDAMFRLEKQLDSRRHARWLPTLVDFVKTADRPGRSDRAGQIVRDRAGSQVWRAFEKVRAFAPAIRWADVATLHGLRIEAKRLRYSLEFLGDVLGPDRAWLIERLVALQDHLGALNDATLTAAAVRSFLGAHHLELEPSDRAELAAYLDDQERRARTLRRSVGRPWRPIAGITFARRLARTAIVP